MAGKDEADVCPGEANPQWAGHWVYLSVCEMGSAGAPTTASSLRWLCIGVLVAASMQREVALSTHGCLLCALGRCPR